MLPAPMPEAVPLKPAADAACGQCQTMFQKLLSKSGAAAEAEPDILVQTVVVFRSAEPAEAMLPRPLMFVLDGNIPSVLVDHGPVQNLIPVTQAWAVVRS